MTLFAELELRKIRLMTAGLAAALAAGGVGEGFEPSSDSPGRVVGHGLTVALRLGGVVVGGFDAVGQGAPGGESAAGPWR